MTSSPSGESMTAMFDRPTTATGFSAITNTCFEVYQPGMTDHDDPDLWQKLDVEMHVLTAPNTFSLHTP